MPTLSVAIPTYNRHEALRSTLRALRDQAREDVELVVVDNCSNPPVESIVQEVLAGSNWHFRVVRNAGNVGMCGNILRCFEVAQGEWLWALSDDDEVKPDAIATIIQTIERHPDLLFAVYSLHAIPVTQELVYDSADSFFRALNSIPQIIFISVTFYHRKELIPHLSGAYNFVDTGSPHTALLLLAGLAGSKRKLAYFPTEIVEWKPPTESERYSHFAMIGLSKLWTLCRGESRRRFAQLMVRDSPRPFRLFTHLVRDATKGRNREHLGIMLDEYLYAYSKMCGGIRGAFWRGPARLIAHLGLRFAPASKALNELVSRILRGRTICYDANPVSVSSFLRLSETASEKASHP